LQQETIQKDVLERLICLLEKAHLPVKLDASVPLVEILTKMKHDKKHAHQRLRWVLLKTLGEPRICEEVTEQQITQALVICGASP
jgi:3-dehydroquinate synthase